jgi:hypothetical protein
LFFASLASSRSLCDFLLDVASTKYPESAGLHAGGVGDSGQTGADPATVWRIIDNM